MPFGTKPFLRRARKCGVHAALVAKFRELAGDHLLHTWNGNNRHAFAEVAHFNGTQEPGLVVSVRLRRTCTGEFYLVRERFVLRPTDGGPMVREEAIA